jgi:hypothetical protein
MAETIDQTATRLNSLITDSKADLVTRLVASESVDGPDPERTLSNTSLLLKTLATFYGDTKSDFIPMVITADIRDQMIQVEGAIADFLTPVQPVPVKSASGLLKLLEELYAYCLQYGLITYGFTGKIAQEQIELIRRTRQQTESVAHKMLVAFNGHESELIRKMDTFGKLLMQSESDFNAKVTERLNALQPSIDGLEALLAAGQENSVEVGAILKAATENATAVAKVRNDLDAAAIAVTADFNARKTTADGEFATIQALSLQVQKLEADAKTMHQAVTDAKSNITNQLTQITSFYGEIEKYRLQMTDTGKASQSHLAELS